MPINIGRFRNISERGQRKVRNLLMVFAVLLGILGGLGLTTFHYAKGTSYLSSDPEVCVNCHIMNPQYDSWQKASHHSHATCVDCHLPHDFVGKYIAKAENGYHHSKAFTLQNFHEPIMIKEKNSKILQENCIECHSAMVDEMKSNGFDEEKNMKCVHCHATVGHGSLPTGIGSANGGDY